MKKKKGCESKKWEKWMIKDSKANNLEKSIISGHYVFSNPAFIELKKELEFELRKKSLNLDIFLKNEIKKNISTSGSNNFNDSFDIIDIDELIYFIHFFIVALCTYKQTCLKS